MDGFFLTLLTAGTISKTSAKQEAMMDTAGKKIAGVSKIPGERKSSDIAATVSTKFLLSTVASAVLRFLFSVLHTIKIICTNDELEFGRDCAAMLFEIRIVAIRFQASDTASGRENRLRYHTMHPGL